jgi:hypothetical protein
MREPGVIDMGAVNYPAKNLICVSQDVALRVSRVFNLAGL